ncbi:cytochrome P450 [Gloeophyllum trabeum ATCC 11539]|uniref:Cytochrome P450 n=1 Tax=Gloeophyllum trabeum (strain ATCC 11539 / FP-39264 / Madison 617) TaxID=670483 RepID=S7Q7I4_GLOTA|nr:cytochrome P450 [Gloeophyllum trabeum ATCC 11539]EPQ55423.1 cytochrome P450 [Gloeophyllum trabeum ATCC 11539]
MFSPTPSLLACVVFLVAYVYKRWSRSSLSHIPGPKSQSFVLGHLTDVFQGGAAKADFKWKDSFGSVVRYKGILGEDHLMISDPKALQYILHTSAYSFLKETGGKRAISHIINGHSLNSVDAGDVHKRHRKVMLPAFGGPEAKALFPVFRKHAQEASGSHLEPGAYAEALDISAVFNIPSWMSRATLDAIGEAAFDYQFDSLRNGDSELGKAYEVVNITLFGIQSTFRVLYDALMDRLPARIVEKFFTVWPSRRFRMMVNTAEVSTRVAKQLVTDKREAIGLGRNSKDVMMKGNLSTNPKARLSDEELYAEMRIILFAGHETTSTTLTWTLWEIAKHPDVQDKLRKEIQDTEAKVRAHSGGTQMELSLADIEGMSYLQAVLKASLRLHPAFPRIVRMVKDDQVVPLSTPIRSTTGEILEKIVIPAGTKIMLSIAAYNSRDKDMWGPDADAFNPERWLSGTERRKDQTAVGVVGNVMTFSSGTRSCIGWRFAMTEMQAFLVELVSKFEFSPAVDERRIRREGPALMFPVVDGEVGDGVKLPLRVSLVREA